ncbi:MAG: 1-acyl-sn-glycerol-3-phosphate acyltransferase [Tissierellia bacterium]|nr:1-acyl-sn-glycerol-3-phosphate acyltransferase [Tissierellia bacterium]
MSFYNFIKAIATAVFKIIYRINVYGKGNIPKQGNLIICSNHIHNFDPIIIALVYPRQISWMAKKQLFKYKIPAFFLSKLGAFPVDRDEADLSTFKKSLNVLKNHGVLGIFPEGTRVKTIDLENAKPGVGLIALRSKANVLPVFIEGNYKPFSRINVYFGGIIDLSQYHDKRVSKEDYLLVSKDILKSIYSIKQRGEK